MTYSSNILVLSPESSTNWLFDDNILFNIIISNRKVVMDINDFHRYERLAGTSDVDFIKFFLLSILRLNHIIEPLNYKELLKNKVKENLDFIDNEVKIFNEVVRNKEIFEIEIEKGYVNYLKFISNKKDIVAITNNEKDINNFELETASAMNHLDIIRKGKFDKYQKTAYLRRLCTKNMATYRIASILNGEIFDSTEYLSGFLLLQQKGLKIEDKYAFDVHRLNSNFLLIKEYLIKHRFINSSKILPISISLLQGLNRSSKGLVNKVREEMETQSFESIKTEITTFLHNEYKQKITDAIPNLLKSVTGLKLGIVSYLSIIQNCIDLTNMDSFKKGYSVTSQLISNAFRYEKGLRTDYKLSYLINKFKSFFSKDLKNDDLNWMNTQRSMDEWTSGLYIPYYENNYN